MSSSRQAVVKRGREEDDEEKRGPSEVHDEAAPDKKKRRRGSTATGGGGQGRARSQAKTRKRGQGGRAAGGRADRPWLAWWEAERRRQEEEEERRARVGALFVGLPDVLHGLIASWLGRRDLLKLCGCSRFFNKTYTGRVTSGLLWDTLLEEPSMWARRSDVGSFEDEDHEGGAREAADREEPGGSIASSQLPKWQRRVTRVLSRFSNLRKLVVREEQAVLAVAAALHASGGEDGAALLQQLEYLEVWAPVTATRELLLALSTKQRDGGGIACVCPGLRHLVLLDYFNESEWMEELISMDVLEPLVDAMTRRGEAGAASLLTLSLPLHYNSASDGRLGRLLSHLLLTSKSCESLEALLIDGYLEGECVRALAAYLFSDRAASLRRFRCKWRGSLEPEPDGRPTIPSALASGRLPMLEDVDLKPMFLAAEDEDQLAQWAASPSASRLVSLRLKLPELRPVLRGAMESHGWPRLRTLIIADYEAMDAAVTVLVDGMESRGAMPCLECLEMDAVGTQGVVRLAAFLAQGKGCSRTLRKLEFGNSTATDEAGAQLGRAIQAGGLASLQELHLDYNEAWGDATMCAVVEALENGQGQSLKEVNMNGTGMGSVGYQRIMQAVRSGLRKMPEISFMGCDVPEMRQADGADSFFPIQTLGSIMDGARKGRNRLLGPDPAPVVLPSIVY